MLLPAARHPIVLPAGHSSLRRPLSTASTPHVPVIRSLAALRRWRQDARDRHLSVGCVPTMGALHEGHLNLVRESLRRNPLTVMTLFVNPMQFAPTEDLSSYPRTMERDLELLRSLLPPPPQSQSPPPQPLQTQEPVQPSAGPSTGPAPPRNVQAGDLRSDESPLVVFAPDDSVMYPLKGELQDLQKHRGVTVELKGWGEVMEGQSRPQFFKGVATVCTKLFNAVEPDHAYFGQKDIQQALLLRIMLKDLLLAHPSPENMHILPTTRDPTDHLALSSRNAYLSAPERAVAPVLYRALSAARDLWSSGQTTGEDMISAATAVISEQQQASLDDGSGVEVRHDYVEVFDRETFEPIRGPINPQRKAVVSGAVWVGRTRLIDNLLLGWEVD